MKLIYVFGSDSYYPNGGVEDLLALVDNQANNKLDADGWLLPAVLTEAMDKVDLRPDSLQVMHLAENGAPAYIENWMRISSIKPFDHVGTALSDVVITAGLYKYARYRQRSTRDVPVVA